MTLQLPADSPWFLLAAADLILFLHIAGGAVALVSGLRDVAKVVTRSL